MDRRSVALIQNIPWITGLLLKMPKSSGNVRRVSTFVVEQLKHRRQKLRENKDVLYYLVSQRSSLYDAQWNLFVASGEWGFTWSRADALLQSHQRHCSRGDSRFRYYFDCSHRFILLLDDTSAVLRKLESRSRFNFSSWRIHTTQHKQIGWNAVFECLHVRITSFSVLKDSSWPDRFRNEALRLQPPLPTNLQRAPANGSGGKMIGS